MKQLLTKIAENVRESIVDFAGKKEAWKIVKKTKRDSTKMIDKIAENAIISSIKNYKVKAAVLSEEIGFVKLCEDPEFIFVVDPIDGTYNSLVNLPFYSVSIAVAKYSHYPTFADIKYATVMNLYTGDVFYAEKSKGAMFNNEYIKKYNGDAYCIYFQELDDKKFRLASKIAKNASKIRSFGSVALELCYVALGVFEALVDIRGSIRNVDIAAGLLILKESGGVFGDMYGREINLKIDRIESTTLIACKNKKVYKNILKKIETEIKKL